MLRQGMTGLQPMGEAPWCNVSYLHGLYLSSATALTLETILCMNTVQTSSQKT